MRFCTNLEMYHDHSSYKAFGRRAALLFGGKIALSAVLVGRLYHLQVLESDRYKLLADENRINLRLLPPPRGRILDRFGTPMAINRDNYRVVFVAERAPDVGHTLDLLGRLISIGEGDRRRILREVKRRRNFVAITVRKNLTWEEVSRIEVNAPDLPGVSIDVGQTREYPYGPIAAHVVGYVAAVSEKEQTGDPLLELPGFRIGKSGIEKTYDLKMRGKGGNSQLEVNAIGRVIRELARNEGEPGNDVALTIDLELQKFAVERLSQERSGAAAVIDIATGEVLVLAAIPSYDPNGFSKGLSSRAWRALLSDPLVPLTNKAIAGQYAPGSTFKMIVALAALEHGVISSQQRVHCSGYVKLGTSRFHCWKKHGHGWVDMNMGLQQSCDVYFYELARRVGIDRIAKMARRFGLGSTLGLDIPGEYAGLVPSRKWKRETIGIPWQKGETLITAIGQGYLLATPLQLAVMTARLATKGLAVVPRLTLGIVGKDEVIPPTKPEFGPIGVSKAAFDIVLKGMQAVTNTPRGTAYRARIKEPGMAMAGKTGTSQVRRISKGEREAGVIKNKDLPWRERDHALFVAFAPVQSPRYAAAVVIEHGGGGSKVAVPIVRDILIETQKRDPARREPWPRLATAGRSQGRS